MVKITTQFRDVSGLRENPDVQHAINRDLCIYGLHNSKFFPLGLRSKTSSLKVKNAQVVYTNQARRGGKGTAVLNCSKVQATVWNKSLLFSMSVLYSDLKIFKTLV